MIGPRRALAALCIACGLGATTPAAAAPDAAPPAMQIDAAVSRALTTLGTALALEFAAQMASGSSRDFDPGPALEAALRRLLDSRETQAMLERLVDSAGAGDDALPPALRAALAGVLKGAMAAARREIGRELATP
jgi:hypothetical protein